jgi:hypothetical protein
VTDSSTALFFRGILVPSGEKASKGKKGIKVNGKR